MAVVKSHIYSALEGWSNDGRGEGVLIDRRAQEGKRLKQARNLLREQGGEKGRVGGLIRRGYRPISEGKDGDGRLYCY